MTCSIESAIIAEAAPKKYARNTGRRSAGNDTALSAIELGVAAEDALLVERDAALGAKIGGKARTLHHALVERDEPWILGLERAHRARKGVAQAFDHLEERELHVTEGLSALQALEVIHVLRQPVLAEILRPAPRLRLLILVVKPAGDRMVRVVYFDQPVADRELLLVQPEPRRVALRREPQARREPVQDHRRLRNDQLSRAQERRREWPILDRAAFHEVHHGSHAFRPPRDVDIVRARILEREADEFAAALDRGPVVELVSHKTAGLSGSSFGLTPRAGNSRARICVSAAMASSAPCSCSPALKARSMPRQIASHSCCGTRAAMPRSARISMRRSTSCT